MSNQVVNFNQTQIFKSRVVKCGLRMDIIKGFILKIRLDYVLKLC